MKTITVDEFLEGIASIYAEQPSYQLGHDGSDGTCDCIGMPRGASKRKGVTDIKNFSGTNMAARKTIKDLTPLKSTGELQLGEVVLKTRDANDPSYPLPDRYRKGHSDYNSKWGETNFTHIGTVTGVNPLEITHMTSPKPKKDTKLGNWKYRGKLPWVNYGGEPGPGPEPEPGEWAYVYAENGKPVKMRAKPSTSCNSYWEVPVGSQVKILEKGTDWHHIQWAGQDGYMMKQFLITGGTDLYTVTIPNLPKEQAEKLCKEWNGATMEAQKG